MSKPALTIIMPALNEAANIEKAMSNCLAAADDLGIDTEIVVINDGSSDGTPDLVRAAMAREPRIRLLEHPSRMGIGASFWDGVAAAHGDAVCMLPGDNENDPVEILRYHGLLNHVDIVIPFIFNKEVRSLFRNALSFIYRFIINTTFLVYFNYTNGTVLYRRDLLNELDFHSTGFFFQTDILVRCVKRGYLFAEVPCRLDVRPHGVSKATTFPSLMQVVRGYMRLVRDTYRRPGAQIPRRFAAGSQSEKRRTESDKNETPVR